MTSASDWQGGVGRNWAAEWERTDRTFAALTPDLLRAIAAEPGAKVVDIGCGAGEIALAVARDRPAAQVVGVDISAELVETAMTRAEGLANLSFTVADAASWIAPGGAPDLYVSRHGVMFFEDPPAAFAHLARRAAPGARMVFSCFRSVSENTWATEIRELLPPAKPVAADPFAPGPFAFADPDHVRRCLKGWRDVTFRKLDFAYVAGTGTNPVADALSLLSRIGPAAAAIRTLPDNARPAFERGLLELVQSRHVGGRVCFPAAAWLVSAAADNA
ncbi:class I SAM-dependent methyltransferase [Novosphingobium sp. Chol11]|uniref:class I SAM-dependent methyltransferase n=1 Tax=Novosphingobium sp. Chol11 TaxID=1385763 RepID=UPI0025F12145|nr:class I SAM-dependent methyltransferase [Novosphingobium sp. Chol11]